MKRSIPRPQRRLRFLFLAGVVAFFTACTEPEPVPPTFSVFGITDKFFDVESLGENTFLALGYRSKILRSEDGGVTWQKYSKPWERSLARFTFLDAERGWGVGHLGKIFQTTDGGKSWVEQKSATENPLFDVDFVDENFGVAVGDLTTVSFTYDGGATWKAMQLEKPHVGVRPDMSLAISDPILYGVDFLDEKRGFVSGEYGQIRRTLDGGETWTEQHETLLGGKVRDVMSLPTLMCIRFRDAQNGIAVGTYGKIVYTTDGGETWLYAESPVTTPLYDIRLLPNGDAVITGSSGVLLVGNPEKGFHPAELPAGVYTWISSADFDASGRGVAAGGFGVIMTSSDYGKTWTQTLYQ